MNNPIQKRHHTVVGGANFCGLLCCLIICATVVFVALRFAPRSEPQRRLWTPVVVQTNGSDVIIGATRQLAFWTPSSKTQDYLHKENGEVVPNEKWEVIPNEDAVINFGTMLHTNKNIL